MIVNIKQISTGKLIHEKIEIQDVMLGTHSECDKLLVFMPDKTVKQFQPRDDYMVYDPAADDDPAMELENNPNLFQELKSEIAELRSELQELKYYPKEDVAE